MTVASDVRSQNNPASFRTGALRVLLIDEDWAQTLYLAHSLASLGCEVQVLTSTASNRGPYRSRRIEQFAAPLVDSSDYLSFLESVVQQGFDCVMLLSEAIMRRVWDAAPAWLSIVFPPTDDQQRRLLRDKRCLSEFLAPLGVRVPRIVTAYDAESVKRALRELGTPVVVKGWAGNAGTEVRFANDEAEVLSAVDELVASTGRYPFLQQFIDGPTILSGGLFLNGEPLRLYAGEMIETYPPRVGPSLRHRTTHAPDLLRQTVIAMKALRWTGLAEGDFIRGPDGQFYFLEINPRPWSSIPLSARAGVDFFTPLHQMLLGETPAQDLYYADDVDSVVFPQRMLAHVRRHGFALRAFARVATDYRSWRAVPWTQPRLALHLVSWLLNRLREKRARSARVAAVAG